jgi:hypothetical protein
MNLNGIFRNGFVLFLAIGLVLVDLRPAVAAGSCTSLYRKKRNRAALYFGGALTAEFLSLCSLPHLEENFMKKQVLNHRKVSQNFELK